MTKWNYIFGAVTIGVLVGGTIYVIKKAKDAEKQQESAITLEEAREIVARNKAQKEEAAEYEEAVILKEENEHEDVLPISVPKVAPISVRPYELPDEDEEEEEEMDEGIAELDEPNYGVSPGGLTVHPITPLIDFTYFDEDRNVIPKEDTELRYPPDSDEARHQYIRMELADWGDSIDNPVYRLMLTLFEIPLYPTNVGDDVLRTQVMDYKAQFFTLRSKWVKEVSFADIILHYARVAEFNCGETVQYWVEYFMDFNELDYDMTTREIETILLRLASHTYFNDERQTHGLFGLTRESFDDAVRTASRNPDRSVTFEIEFQEFLKTCI